MIPSICRNESREASAVTNHSIKHVSQNKCCEGVMTGFSTTPAHMGQISEDDISSGFTKNSWAKPMIH